MFFLHQQLPFQVSSLSVAFSHRSLAPPGIGVHCRFSVTDEINSRSVAQPKLWLAAIVAAPISKLSGTASELFEDWLTSSANASDCVRLALANGCNSILKLIIRSP